MRFFCAVSATALAVVLVACTQVPANEAASGIGAGGSVGSYSGVKAGGIDDGVAAGRSLCYT